MTASGSQGGTALVQGSTTTVVPFASMKKAYNNIGISDDSNEAAANYDDVGDSFSAQALAAGTPNALTPGAMVTIGQTTFTWPDVPAGTRDNVVTSGQTVDLSGQGTDLGFLGSSQNGTASGTVTVNYTDGSSQSFNLNMADWFANAPAVGDQIATTTSSWNFQSNSIGPHPVSIYFASVPLDQSKTVQSVTLPIVANAGGTTAMHIWAMAIGNGTPTMGAPFSVARRRLRQRRDQRQLQPVRGRFRRHRRELLRAGARGRDADRAHRRRTGDDRRRDRSRGRPRSVRPTT